MGQTQSDTNLDKAWHYSWHSFSLGRFFSLYIFIFCILVFAKWYLIHKYKVLFLGFLFLIFYSDVFLFICVSNFFWWRENLLPLKYIYHYLHLYLYWCTGQTVLMKVSAGTGYLLIQAHERDTLQKVAMILTATL